MLKIKETAELSESYPTYKIGRLCKYCEKPIADHEHATRIFCKRAVLPDGSIKNCKDDFWAENRKEKNDEFSRMMDYHKEIFEKLWFAYYLGQKQMTADELFKLGIHLSRRLDAKINADGSHSHFFVGHELIVKTNSNIITIKKYDGNLF